MLEVCQERSRRSSSRHSHRRPPWEPPQVAGCGDAPGRGCEYGGTKEGWAMTTAVIGTGGIGSAIARCLASGGETLRLASADSDSARRLSAEIGQGAFVAADN